MPALKLVGVELANVCAVSVEYEAPVVGLVTQAPCRARGDYELLCLGALLDLEVSQEFAESLHVPNFGMCRV